MMSLAVLRLVAVTHAAAICLQPILAGVYLNGTGGAQRIHEPVGLAVAAVATIQLLVATIWWRSGGRLTAPLVSLLVLIGESVQIGMGYSRELALHLPLGIALVGAVVGFAVWTRRQQAASS
ncbi:hypothetical protein E1218_26565 [Kribbella turkmenica]|uniref:Uncharacterized protein n=1 Tax=Kribbella turkmenica TaxID=2530375 RepID=A0A4V6PD12_9ACTN|nr:hypothetical protein [Kribbella turkmenica]TDD18206.1 hypothetical protein E1218_26565 [Kribbella turkmenica]